MELELKVDLNASRDYSFQAKCQNVLRSISRQCRSSKPGFGGGGEEI